MEKSSFKPGAAAQSSQSKPSAEDVHRIDEYGGRYQCAGRGLSEQEAFGSDQMPVQNDAMPVRSLRSVGA